MCPNIENLNRVISALHSQNRDRNYKFKPIMVEDLKDIKKSDKYVYYGILEISDDTNVATFFNSKQKIMIIENTQIITFFDDLVITDNLGNVQAVPLGMFTGYIIFY